MTNSLQFQVRELVEEVDLLRKLADGFLEEGANSVLRKVTEQLETLYSRRDSLTITVGPSWPIRTVACDGGYERDEGGAHKDLFAELVFKWQLNPLDRPSKKTPAKRIVQIDGLASSVARLKLTRGDEFSEIASWRMEFGDSQSPGAFFHAQIPDTMETPKQDDECADLVSKWPHWLPIPRLPIPAMTPMIALEFTLAEVFQDRWPQHLASGGHDVDKWRALQRRRFVRYFEWQAENASISGPGSPIIATKLAKPTSNLFLSR